MAVLKVPVTKGKGEIEIDTDAIPEAVYAEALLQGLKVLVNRGASKITKETYPEAEELKVAAMAKAEEQKAMLMEGKVKKTAGGKSKVSGAVMTEARRIARGLVKSEMKRLNMKVSHVEASEITKAANALIEANPAIIQAAEEEIAKRASVNVPIDVAAIPTSAKLVAKAEKEKAEKKATLSASKAGKVKTRAKPQAEAGATAH